MCGGTAALYPSSYFENGLSPRVRGNLIPFVLDCLKVGSIPACAGEPRTSLTRSSRYLVYPRVCGGTHLLAHFHFSFRGLSPRVRGNPLARPFPLLLSRSIPACAGEPANLRLAPHAHRVYPRVCGGTYLSYSAMAIAAGLSPRVRGNRSITACMNPFSGSIPACAGEPAVAETLKSDWKVYPRVCGETRFPPARLLRLKGLSPRVRGNRGQVVLRVVVGGSIPACAGEPSVGAGRRHFAKVYPRVCGGTVPKMRLTSPVAGLSPRVRGNHAIRSVGDSCDGSIPACAGEPDGD